MQRGVNQSTILGWVGQDAVSKEISNTTITKFSLATSEEWTDKNGEEKKKVEWHHIVTFGKHAEFLATRVKKGMEIYVQGKKNTSKWKDNDGVERSSVEVHAQTVHLLNNKANNESKKVETKKDNSDIPF